MITLEDFINNLTDTDRRGIICDYELFSGSCVVSNNAPLRMHTLAYMEHASIPHTNILLVMSVVAAACHRYYALKYIEDTFD